MSGLGGEVDDTGTGPLGGGVVAVVHGGCGGDMAGTEGAKGVETKVGGHGGRVGRRRGGEEYKSGAGDQLSWIRADGYPLTENRWRLVSIRKQGAGESHEADLAQFAAGASSAGSLISLSLDWEMPYRGGHCLDSRAMSHPTEFDILKASHKYSSIPASLRAPHAHLPTDSSATTHTTQHPGTISLPKSTTTASTASLRSAISNTTSLATCVVSPSLFHPSPHPQFALRWRTEAEVLDGIGDTSCANTRCALHRPDSPTDLSTLELPFAYQEHGEQKEALVKIVLCPRCVRKLMWKRRHDRRDGKHKGAASTSHSTGGDREATDEGRPERQSLGKRRRSHSPSRS